LRRSHEREENPFIFPRIYNVITRNIGRWDIIWLHAPHPVSLIFAYVCRRIDKPFFIFIRQDLKEYVGCRNKGGRRALAVLMAMVLEYVFRYLSRDTLTFTVGKQLFNKYKKDGRPICQSAVSLVSDRDIGVTPSKKVNDPLGRVSLLSVARLDPEKGIIDIIKAMHQVVTDGNTHIVLEVVGTGSEEGNLRREVENRGLQKYVHFLGYVAHSEKLYDLYKASDIFVLASLSEGLPQTLLEAMAFGLPIVATNVGGIPHIIRDGHNGLLVNPGSPREISDAIYRLTRDSSLGNRLIRNGFSTVRKHTIEAERDRVIHRIQQFLADKRRRV
jgi:glycosyltransferase involved in cell wall biosynthesis